jgi:hypothetical protein
MSPKGLVLVSLQGHLTADALKAALLGAEQKFRDTNRMGLVVDATRMTGYEAAARELFVDWHRQQRGRVSRVAIVTNVVLWHMVIRAMSFAASVPMQAFRELASAMAWAEEGQGR